MINIHQKSAYNIYIDLNQNAIGNCLDDIWDNLRTFTYLGMDSEMRKTFVHFCYMIGILDLLTVWLHPIVGGRITVNKTMTILIFKTIILPKFESKKVRIWHSFYTFKRYYNSYSKWLHLLPFVWPVWCIFDVVCVTWWIGSTISKRVLYIHTRNQGLG